MIHFQTPLRVELVQEIDLFQTVLTYLYPADILYHKQQESISQTHLDSLWIAQSGGMPVGRVAIYKNQKATSEPEQVYYMGYYECIDDDWVAAYLFKTLLKYIRGKQGKYVVGALYDLLAASGEYVPKPDYYAQQWHGIGFEEMSSCAQYMEIVYPSMPLLPAPYVHTFFGKQL